MLYVMILLFNYKKEHLMSKKLRRLIHSQDQIKVAQHAADNAELVMGWYVRLAALFAASFFYFWYYFSGQPWGAF
jgi:hypothetical protein